MTQDKGSSIYKAVSDIVPWELERVQVVPAPKARRMPTDVLWMHRGAFIVPVDGEPFVETEALQDLAFPRVRYRCTVRWVVMFWGVAPEDRDRDAEAPAQEIPADRNLPQDDGLGVDDEDSLPRASRTAAPQPSQH